MQTNDTPRRASMDELRDFANKVRNAGGGNPIDALIPAVPSDSTQCLIARNLNFNCVVGGNGITADDEREGRDWSMTVVDGNVAERIAEAIGSVVRPVYEVDEWDSYVLDREDGPVAYAIPLPAEIGQVAADFDSASVVAKRGARTEADVQLVRDMLPYIEESQREALGIASLVTKDGKVVL